MFAHDLGLRLLETFIGTADFAQSGMDPLDVHNLASAHPTLDAAMTLREHDAALAVAEPPPPMDDVLAAMEAGRVAMAPLADAIAEALQIRRWCEEKIAELSAARPLGEEAFAVYCDRHLSPLENWEVTVHPRKCVLAHLANDDSAELQMHISVTSQIIEFQGDDVYIASAGADEPASIHDAAWAEGLAVAEMLGVAAMYTRDHGAVALAALALHNA